MDVVHGVPDVLRKYWSAYRYLWESEQGPFFGPYLEDTLEAHEQVPDLEAFLGLFVLGRVAEIVHDAGQEVGLGQVEESVQHENPVLVELYELVRVNFPNFIPAQKIKINGSSTKCQGQKQVL